MKYLHLILFFALPQFLLANPKGEKVIAGDATFTRNGTSLSVNQKSLKAIINWDDFSIKEGEITKFIQPSNTAAVLNRVTGRNPTKIYGLLKGNGKVYLINSNGIFIGPKGVVDTYGFIASTLDIADDNFCKGGILHLKQKGGWWEYFFGVKEGKIVNEGAISTNEGGLFLLAPNIENKGSLTAGGGICGVYSGTELFLVGDNKEPFIVKINGFGKIDNSGTIDCLVAELKASGENLASLAINQRGIIRAKGVENRGGKIILTAESGKIVNSGELNANGVKKGGEINIAAPVLEIKDNALLSVDGGEEEGGTICINCENAFLEEKSRLSAEGSIGSGGNIFITSTKGCSLLGDITAACQTEGGAAGNLVLKVPNFYLGEGCCTSKKLSNYLEKANVTIETPTKGEIRLGGKEEAASLIEWESANKLALHSAHIVFSPSLVLINKSKKVGKIILEAINPDTGRGIELKQCNISLCNGSALFKGRNVNDEGIGVSVLGGKISIEKGELLLDGASRSGDGVILDGAKIKGGVLHTVIQGEGRCGVAFLKDSDTNIDITKGIIDIKGSGYDGGKEGIILTGNVNLQQGSLRLIGESENCAGVILEGKIKALDGNLQIIGKSKEGDGVIIKNADIAVSKIIEIKGCSKTDNTAVVIEKDSIEVGRLCSIESNNFIAVDETSFNISDGGALRFNADKIFAKDLQSHCDTSVNGKGQLILIGNEVDLRGWKIDVKEAKIKIGEKGDGKLVLKEGLCSKRTFVEGGNFTNSIYTYFGGNRWDITDLNAGYVKGGYNFNFVNIQNIISCQDNGNFFRSIQNIFNEKDLDRIYLHLKGDLSLGFYSEKSVDLFISTQRDPSIHFALPEIRRKRFFVEDNDREYNFKNVFFEKHLKNISLNIAIQSKDLICSNDEEEKKKGEIVDIRDKLLGEEDKKVVKSELPYSDRKM